MKPLRSLNPGIIMTNKEGTITACNTLAMIILNQRSIRGKTIEAIEDLLDEVNTLRCFCEDHILYFIEPKGIPYTFEHILAFNPAGYAICDSEGKIVYCNEKFKDIFGNNSPEDSILAYSVDKLMAERSEEWMGLDLIKNIKKDVSVSIRTGDSTVDVVLRPILDEEGELNYISIRCVDFTLANKLKVQLAQAKKEIQDYKEKEHLIRSEDAQYFLMESSQMKEVYDLADDVASGNMPVLVYGKTGAGKSAIAKMIHERSLQKTGPFVVADCKIIPDTIMDSTIFGYEKGFFEGVLTTGKEGLINKAEGGILVIDEISKMPLDIQEKLMEFIRERKYRPAGSVQAFRANVRIIVTTSIDLHQELKEGMFREDLFSRISAATVNLPSLFQHKEDLLPMAEYYLEYFNKKYNQRRILSKDVKLAFSRYNWPRNFKEMRRVMEFLVAGGNGEITLNELPIAMANKQAESLIGTDSEDEGFRGGKNFDEMVEGYERKIVNYYYEKNSSSYKMAEALGLSQTKANRLIQKYIK